MLFFKEFVVWILSSDDKQHEKQIILNFLLLLLYTISYLIFAKPSTKKSGIGHKMLLPSNLLTISFREDSTSENIFRNSIPISKIKIKIFWSLTEPILFSFWVSQEINFFLFVLEKCCFSCLSIQTQLFREGKDYIKLQIYYYYFFFTLWYHPYHTGPTNPFRGKWFLLEFVLGESGFY